MQQTLVAVQTVLPREDIPIGTAIVMFSQTLGGALFISVAQNVFTNTLLQNIKKIVPDLDPAVVMATGATSLKSVIPSQYLGGVQQAYNASLINCTYAHGATLRDCRKMMLTYISRLLCGSGHERVIHSRLGADGVEERQGQED